MDAAVFVQVAHKGQRRHTGEAYVQHLFAVRDLLAQAGVTDRYVLDAALLHDCLEDGNLSQDYLAFRFGPLIANIVAALSKEPIWHTRSIRAKSHLDALENAWTRYPESLLIKIADRLHNIQTLRGFPPRKQRAYLQETQRDLLPLFRRSARAAAAGRFQVPLLRLLRALEQAVHAAEQDHSATA